MPFVTVPYSPMGFFPCVMLIISNAHDLASSPQGAHIRRQGETA